MNDENFKGDDYIGSYFKYNQTVDGLKWATIPATTSEGIIPYYTKDATTGTLTPLFAHEASIPTPGCSFVKSSTDNTTIIWEGDLLTEDSKMELARTAAYPQITLRGNFTDTSDSPGNCALLRIYYNKDYIEDYDIYSTVFIDIQAPGGNGAVHHNPGGWNGDSGGSGGGGGAYCRLGIDLSYDDSWFGGGVSKKVEIKPYRQQEFVKVATAGSAMSTPLDTGLTIGYGRNATEGKKTGAGAGGTVTKFGNYKIPKWIKYKEVNGGSGGIGGGDDESGKAAPDLASVKKYAPMFNETLIYGYASDGGAGGASDGGSCGGGGGGAAFLCSGGNGAGHNNDANNNWSGYGSSVSGDIYGGGGGGGHFANPVAGDTNVRDPGNGRPGVFRIYGIKYPALTMRPPVVSNIVATISDDTTTRLKFTVTNKNDFDVTLNTTIRDSSSNDVGNGVKTNNIKAKSSSNL